MHKTTSNIEIYVATHSNPISFDLPDCYKRIQLNAAINGRWGDFLHDDDSEDNISVKNESFCELTALYVLWKHCNAKFKGLSHYRRYFGNNAEVPFLAYGRVQEKNVTNKCIQEKTVEDLLEKKDIIIPQPICPFPFTVAEELEKYCYKKDIDILRSILTEKYPSYSETFETVLKSKNISYCNMLIAGRETFDEYCFWLFDILFEADRRIDISDYDPAHKRVFGYMAEVLLNVYVKYKGMKPAYMPVIITEMSGIKGSMIEKMSDISTRHPNSPFLSKVIQHYRFRYSRYSNYKDCVSKGSQPDTIVPKDISDIKKVLKEWGFENIRKPFTDCVSEEYLRDTVCGDAYYGMCLAYNCRNISEKQTNEIKGILEKKYNKYVVVRHL